LIISSLDRDEIPNEDWQIVITADHGHTRTGGHGSQTSLERTIPFIVASQSVVQGRAGPVADGLLVSHADVAPTVLEHFEIPIPDRYAGVSRAAGVLPDFNVHDATNDTAVAG
jgi:arylsulfatase A-like enzyme